MVVIASIKQYELPLVSRYFRLCEGQHCRALPARSPDNVDRLVTVAFHDAGPDGNVLHPPSAGRIGDGGGDASQVRRGLHA